MHPDQLSDSASPHSNEARQRAPEASRQVKGQGQAGWPGVPGSPASRHAQGRGQRPRGAHAGLGGRQECPSRSGRQSRGALGMQTWGASGEPGMGEGFAGPGGGAGLAERVPWGRPGGAPACRALGSAGGGSPPLSPGGLPAGFRMVRTNAAAAAEAGPQASDGPPDPTPQSRCGMWGSGCLPPGPTRPRGRASGRRHRGRGRRETRGGSGCHFT